MKARVFWKDIKNGIPTNAGNCPVQRAFQRKFKRAEVWVGAYTLVVGSKDYRLSDATEKWITAAIENKKSVRPFIAEAYD